MCDQSEVSYRPGNVVWVKLNPVWWPGIVADSEEIPPDILKTLRKTPIAIVKFFQETEVFEYVHKLSNIYHYNCLKKNDFIRKGLDIYRSKNRDAPSNMKLFPSDVARAEVLTGGNPDILNDKIFQPEEKTTYADLFANTKKSPKKIKSNIKKKSSTQIATQQSNITRIITHPRFIKLNSGLETDYEVRERKQEPIRAECDEEDNSPPTTYRCQDCDFTTIRLNVIILHNKSHTRNYTKPAPSKLSKRRNISAVRVQERPFVNKWESLQKAEPVKSKILETNGTVLKARKKGRPRKVIEPSSTIAGNVVAKTKEGETKVVSCPSTTKPKCGVPQKDAIQESLLEDWAESETEQDNFENGDNSFGNSVIETQMMSTNEEKTFNECYSANKKDEFDFDDSEEQLVIDKSKIRAGRKIPRVLEQKSEEVEKNETQNVKKRKVTGIQEKHDDVKIRIPENESKNAGVGNMKKRRMSKQEDTRIQIQEDVERTSGNENKRRHMSSSLQRRSKDTKIESHKVIKKNSQLTDVRKSGAPRASEREVKEEKVSKMNVIDLTEKKIVDVKRKYKIENTNKLKKEEKEEVSRIEEVPTEVEIEEMQEEIEVGGEIEIEIEDTMDDEQTSMVNISTSLDKKVENDSKEKEAAELIQKVDKLLQEVSVSSKLPELPQLLKKEHSRSNDANLIKHTVDDENQIIESISLINDDSSDGFDEKKHHLNCEIQNSTLETGIVNPIDNVEDTSDSSPEIVSVEMPTSRSKGLIKKKLPTIISPTMTSLEKRPPVRFTMMSKLRNVNPYQMVKKNTGPMISDNTAKILKTVQQQKLQQFRARSLLKQVKPVDPRNMPRPSAFGQQAVLNTPRMATKSHPNKLIVVKPMSTQHPTTIDKIDLTGSKDLIISSGQISGTTKSSHQTRPIFPKTVADNMVAIDKVTPKNVPVSSLPSTPRAVTSTVKLVSSSGSVPISTQNQSEIITLNDDIECSNVQMEEIDYIVDEAGNLIAESDNVCSTSKKEDILAKALQDTDVLQAEITLPSSSTILLGSGNSAQNSSSTTVYENVTLNTPPIMSSFEVPSQTVNSSNTISEISEYIIISDPDNIQ